MPPVRRKLLVFVALVAVGLGGFGWLQYSGDPPKRRPPSERGRAVRVLELAPHDALPRVTGYGVVEARRSWQGVAEVGGTIIEMAEGLEVGRVVPEGTLLFRIDPESYAVEKSRTEASVRSVQAQIDELKAREESARQNLELDNKVLELAKKDLERARKSHEAGVASLTEVEAAERALINAEKAVQAHRSTLLELPATRRVLEAQSAQQQAGVEGARLSLAKTEMVAPFTMRIRQLNASLHQVVGSGQVVVVGDGIDAMEVVAQVPIGTIGPLLGSRPAETPAPAPDAGAGGEKADAGAAAEGESAPAPRPTGRPSAITAFVRLKSQGVESTWNGKFRRFQGIDPETRSLSIVVEVDEPRRREGRTGPPLSPGMHVEVELRGKPRPGCLAIPRHALHRDTVYVVGEGNRLEARKVETALVQEQYACIENGVAAGEQVVITELSPAIEGTLLAPRPDKAAAEWLAAVLEGSPSPAGAKAP